MYDKYVLEDEIGVESFFFDFRTFSSILPHDPICRRFSYIHKQILIYLFILNSGIIKCSPAIICLFFIIGVPVKLTRVKPGFISSGLFVFVDYLEGKKRQARPFPNPNCCMVGPCRKRIFLAVTNRLKMCCGPALTSYVQISAHVKRHRCVCLGGPFR